jgi:hexosaminidase
VGNRPLSRSINNHLAKGKKVHYASKSPYYPTYTAGGDSALTDGVHGGWNNSDKRWQGFIGRGGINLCIDMENVCDIKEIYADFMQICEPGIYLPAKVTIAVSNDSIEFTDLATIEHNVTRDDTLSFKKYGWAGSTKARYIRYRAERGKQGGFMFTDEIVVE